MKRILYLFWDAFTLVFILSLAYTIVASSVFMIIEGPHLLPQSEIELRFYQAAGFLWATSIFLYFGTTTILMHGIFTKKIRAKDIRILREGSTIEFSKDQIKIKSNGQG